MPWLGKSLCPATGVFSYILGGEMAQNPGRNGHLNQHYRLGCMASLPVQILVVANRLAIRSRARRGCTGRRVRRHQLRVTTRKSCPINEIGRIAVHRQMLLGRKRASEQASFERPLWGKRPSVLDVRNGRIAGTPAPRRLLAGSGQSALSARGERRTFRPGTGQRPPSTEALATQYSRLVGRIRR